MTMKTKKQMYQSGGLQLQDITSMLGMLGPVGGAIGTGMQMLNTLTAPQAIPQATSYKNTNAFGYASGGYAFQPNPRDGNNPFNAYINYNRKPLEWFDIPQGTTNRFSSIDIPIEKLGYNSYNVNNNMKDVPRYLYDSHQNQYLLRNVNGQYRLADKDVLPILQKANKYKSGGNLSYASGGELNTVGTAYRVDANNPNMTDSVNLGKINVDHNEVLDGNKIISDMFINPLTGKKISDEYAKLTKAEKNIMDRKNKTDDPIAAQTLKHMNKQKNDLFQLQEMIATLKGERNADGSTKQNYASGGPIPSWINDINTYMNNPIGPDNYIRNFQSEVPNIPTTYGAKQNLYNYNLTHTNNKINTLDALPTSNKLSPLQVPNSLPSTPNMNSYRSTPEISNTVSNNLLDQLTPGDKMAMGVTALSMIPKAISAFNPVQKEPYHLIDTPITLQQMDPSQALMNNNNMYNSQMYNMNNVASNINTANALKANAYATKMNQDANILADYENRNKGMVAQYQDRLANRQAQNNQSIMTTDDLNARNQATQRNRQMGLYNDIAGAGQSLGNAMNQRETDKIALENMKAMAPDVFNNYMSSLPFLSSLMKSKIK